MKMGYVCLVLSDLHLNRLKTKSRKSLGKEVNDLLDQIEKTVDKYIEQGYAVVIMLLGDIFHGSIDNAEEHTRLNNFFSHLRNKVENIYTVVGNHDLNFVKNNPFYTLFKTVNSKNLISNTRKPIVAKGYTNTINILDILTIGNVRFHFNHYGVPTIQASDEEGYVNIGLFHKDLVAKSCIREMEQEFGTDIWQKDHYEFDDNLPSFFNYDYCFFGHLHKIFGIWKIGKLRSCYLYYLASLFRTNEGEVNNKFLTRDIPAIIIENNKFKNIENNFFELMSREQSVNDSEVAVQKLKTKAQRKIREIRTFNSIESNPIDKVKQHFSQDPLVFKVFEDYMSDDNSYKLDLERRLRKEGVDLE